MKQYDKQQPDTIASMFDHIAAQYDLANSLISMNLHKYWNRKLIQRVLRESPPLRYLDLCSGTGEIAFGLLSHLPAPCEAYLLDFSANMLSCAKEKALKPAFERHAIHYLHADAQQIPLPDSSVDAVTIAYGIRNVKHPTQCLAEIFRVLRRGGQCAILELTQPSHRALRWGHAIYMKTFLPLIGKWVASDPQAYSYLCNSIQHFLSPEELERLLKEAGFRGTEIQRLSGGIATIWKAVKPC